MVDIKRIDAAEMWVFRRVSLHSSWRDKLMHESQNITGVGYHYRPGGHTKKRRLAFFRRRSQDVPAGDAHGYIMMYG